MREQPTLLVEERANDMSVISSAKCTNVKLVKRVNGLEEVKRAGS